MKSKVIKSILIISLSIIVILASITLIFVVNQIKTVKDIDLAISNNNYNYTEFISVNNEVKLSTSKKQQNYTELADIPEETRQAFLSIEDKTFYQHKGLNYKRIIKAGLNNVMHKSAVEGASTITQQLVKNRYLSNEKTLNRKIKEAYLAKKLEKVESKDKIFETYLNTIYFGNGAYGIGNAALRFFDKTPAELTLSEGCILAGAIKSPSRYSPINNFENSISRKNLILKEMLNDKYITEEEYNIGLQEEIIIKDIPLSKNGLDLYSEFALLEASKILNMDINNIILGGYKIYTYQNTEEQQILDDVVQNPENYHKNSYGNAPHSLSMIISNENFGVTAVSGKSEYDLTNFCRQPGSLIKPVGVFAPAMEEKQINSLTQILDEKIDYNGYTPGNVGGKFYGYIGIKDILAKSLNIPSIKVCEKLGINKCKEYCEKLGLVLDNSDSGYAIALGGLTNGVSLQSITDSYIPFVNDGNFVQSAFVKSITTKNNLPIYSDKRSGEKIFSKDTAYLMTDILKYSVQNGTSKKLAPLPFSVAGKTGTVGITGTNLNTDAFSLAYTNDHIMSVWLGNYTMEKEYNLEGSNNGGTYCTQMIKDVFTTLYKDNKPEDFERPDSIVELKIDSRSLSEDHIVVLGDNIPERYQIKELFSVNNQPKYQSTKFEVIDKFDISVVVANCKAYVSFDTIDYMEYSLYKKTGLHTELIKKFSGNNQTFEYSDPVDFNTKYSYYVTAKNKFSDATYTTTQQQVYLEKDFNKIIQNKKTNDLDWLFA